MGDEPTGLWLRYGCPVETAIRVQCVAASMFIPTNFSRSSSLLVVSSPHFPATRLLRGQMPTVLIAHSSCARAQPRRPYALRARGYPDLFISLCASTPSARFAARAQEASLPASARRERTSTRPAIV